MSIERIEKMKQYEQEKAMERIQENYKKIEEFKTQKSQILEKKKKMTNNKRKKL